MHRNERETGMQCYMYVPVCALARYLYLEAIIFHSRAIFDRIICAVQLLLLRLKIININITSCELEVSQHNLAVAFLI